MINSFQQVMGHDQAKDLLLKACRRQRVSHAYLFKGPVGVGKKSVARAFSAFLNCRAADNALDSGGRCASCKKFISGNHPDFLTIEPDGSMIKIAQIRELKKGLAFPPFEDGYRVVLLPDIHDNMPRKEVNNSLLKILEELFHFLSHFLLNLNLLLKVLCRFLCSGFQKPNSAFAQKDM